MPKLHVVNDKELKHTFGSGISLNLSPLVFFSSRHVLLDSKIVSILKSCHNQAILSAVQSIVQNTLASEEMAQQHTTYLQGIGFGGLWRFSSQFSQVQ